MLKISKLNKTYPKNVHALINLNLNIEKGIFGLVGPNGSGKSTLMRILATLQGPDSGSIYFNGIDLLKEKEQVRCKLGYLPQDFGVYPTITAENLLRYFALLKGITDPKKREAHISYLLEVTNLQSHRSKKIGSFSGGMKQRFGIAQALLGNPDLMILDEPTAGLDPEERSRFHNLLSELSENIIIILSTHIISDVSEICKNMAIIKNGKILTQISPIEALKAFQNKIWSKAIHPKEIFSYSSKFNVISSKIQYGKTVIKVLNEISPSGFEKALPNLEDIYFSYIHSRES